MNDFAERASWCVASRYEDANHAPEVEVAEGLDLTVEPGDSVVLHAEGSDPDGDALTYGWLRYEDVDTCEADVELESDGPVCTVRVGADAHPGDTIHIIVRVTDECASRETYTVNYRRVIMTVA